MVTRKLDSKWQQGFHAAAEWKMQTSDEQMQNLSFEFCQNIHDKTTEGRVMKKLTAMTIR